jgi:hypothetical protein
LTSAAALADRLPLVILAERQPFGSQFFDELFPLIVGFENIIPAHRMLLSSFFFTVRIIQ